VLGLLWKIGRDTLSPFPPPTGLEGKVWGRKAGQAVGMAGRRFKLVNIVLLNDETCIGNHSQIVGNVLLPLHTTFHKAKTKHRVGASG
jgi:hypothetical protein